MKNKKYTSPLYHEINRIETGLNHIDYGKFTYSHISKERWEEIFGPKIKNKSAANAPGGFIGDT